MLVPEIIIKHIEDIGIEKFSERIAKIYTQEFMTIKGLTKHLAKVNMQKEWIEKEIKKLKEGKK